MTINKKIKETKKITVSELVQKATKDLKQYPVHYFNAKWQYKKFQETKKIHKEGEVLMVYDFAENFRTQYQDKIQAAHWNNSQATIHPVMCYHRCTSSGCNELETHSIVMITDDLVHDYHVVDHMMKGVYSILEKKLNVSKCFEWSDGCQAQYKSKYPFLFLQRNGNLQNFSIYRNVFTLKLKIEMSYSKHHIHFCVTVTCYVLYLPCIANLYRK